MKIIKLQAENIKRISAIEITPDGNMVIIAGKNAQGKSSVLDAIMFALDWKSTSKMNIKPIREGEESALVKVFLDDLIIERTFSGNNTYLKVMTEDGAQYPSPQAMLNSLIGKLSFDPLAFTQLSPKEQVTQLILAGGIDIDLAKFNTSREAFYEERYSVNKEFKKAQALLEQFPEPNMGLPDEEVSIKSLSDALSEAFTLESSNNRVKENLILAKTREGTAKGSIERMDEKMAELATEIDNAHNELAQAQLNVEIAERNVKAIIDPDIQLARKKIEDAEELNSKIRSNRAHYNLENELGALKVKSDELTVEIETLDKGKAATLKEAKLPVAGLTFDDTGVLFEGIPYSQCSASEQLKVSVGIAMALNPTLRVLRIIDGSLLDKDNLKVIEGMAKDKDYQVWIEMVSDKDSNPIAVYIENGKVKKEKKEAKK